MKKIITVLLVSCLYQNMWADNKIIYIYEGADSYKVVCRIENNYIYEGYAGYSKVFGRIENNYIYEGLVGYTKVLYRIDGKYILEGLAGFDVVYNIENNYIYEGLFKDKVLYRIIRR